LEPWSDCPPATARALFSSLIGAPTWRRQPPCSTGNIAGAEGLYSLEPLNPPSSPSTASLSGVARCCHSNAYFSLFSSLFFFDPPNRFVQIPRDRETITGGTVIIGIDYSEVRGGKVTRTKLDCGSNLFELTGSTAQVAGRALRGLPRPETEPSRPWRSVREDLRREGYSSIGTNEEELGRYRRPVLSRCGPLQRAWRSVVFQPRAALVVLMKLSEIHTKLTVALPGCATCSSRVGRQRDEERKIPARLSSAHPYRPARPS
jgi:hypothetical protein